MNSRAILGVLSIFLILGMGVWVLHYDPFTQAKALSTLPNSPLPVPGSFDSPLPTPIPVSTTTPGPSNEAKNALNHIARRDGIPAEALVVVNDHFTVYPNLGRDFQVVTLLDARPEGHFHNLLVDLSTGHVEEDIVAIREAEEKAYLAQYGKLEPALHGRLQKVDDSESLPIAIWVASGEPQRTQEELVAAVAIRFPEAKVALAQTGKLWDIEDPQLAARIKAEYNRLSEADTATRIQPLVTHLERHGLAVVTYGSLPSVTARLTKQQILELAQRDDVGMIYLIEEQGQDETDIAIPTDLVPTVWDRGFDGSGVMIAVVEDGNIDSTVPCLDISDTRNSPQGVEGHKTRVASVAACDHVTYRGVAPGATLLDAGFDSTGSPGMQSQEDAVAALQWAIDSNSAPIANISYGWEEDNSLQWTDRAFDYWARHEFALVVKSAGNTGGSITSPGKGWNVLTVGGTSDNNTVVWADDTMYTSSAYIDPVSTNGDREKPEIVAPARLIRAISSGNVARTRSGTSYAAPQVAGLAALLIDRTETLAAWPEANRAIIMASATHNIEGAALLSDRDGAGAINATFADDIAQNHNTSSTSPCGEPCWWGVSTSSVSEGGFLYRYFDAASGEYVKVAISWWSRADSPGNDYSFDRLDTDFHLGVQRFNGSSWEWVPGAWSASWDNNYELVEFVAPETGNYRIAVYKPRL